MPRLTKKRDEALDHVKVNNRTLRRVEFDVIVDPRFTRCQACRRRLPDAGGYEHWPKGTWIGYESNHLVVCEDCAVRWLDRNPLARKYLECSICGRLDYDASGCTSTLPCSCRDKEHRLCDKCYKRRGDWIELDRSGDTRTARLKLCPRSTEVRVAMTLEGSA